MDTSPLLARRVIPRKERLQKTLAILLLTAIVVATAWVLIGTSPSSELTRFIAVGAIALIGLAASAFFWFKKDESAADKESSRAVRQRINDERQGRGWTHRIWYNTKRFFGGIIVLMGALFVLAGLAVIALQVFIYLKSGEWRSLSVLSVASPYLPWLTNPQSWFGLHDITTDALGIAPVSAVLILMGWLIAGFGSALRERVRR